MAAVTMTAATFVGHWETGYCQRIWSALAKPGDATHVILCVMTANGAREVWDVGP